MELLRHGHYPPEGRATSADSVHTSFSKNCSAVSCAAVNMALVYGFMVVLDKDIGSSGWILVISALLWSTGTIRGPHLQASATSCSADTSWVANRSCRL